jgi:hypothetical protein
MQADINNLVEGRLPDNLQLLWLAASWHPSHVLHRDNSAQPIQPPRPAFLYTSVESTHNS